MKFVVYPNKSDRIRRVNGRLVDGQKISTAPGGWWMLCPDEPAEKRFFRVYGPEDHADPAGGKGLYRSTIEEEGRRA